MIQGFKDLCSFAIYFPIDYIRLMVILVRTTMIYTHVLNRGGRAVQSPGDMLWN